MPKNPAPKGDALSQTLDHAIEGEPGALYALLEERAGLPRNPLDRAVIDDFVREVKARGASADDLVVEMSGMDEDDAPAGTASVVLPVAGIAAVFARAATDDEMLEVAENALGAAADDDRDLVREWTETALAQLGAARGPSLLERLVPREGADSGVAALILGAVTRPEWLSRFKTPTAVVALLESAFTSAVQSPVVSDVLPGFKRLLKALGVAPARLSAQHPEAVRDLLGRWASVRGKRVAPILESNYRALGPVAAAAARAAKQTN